MAENSPSHPISAVIASLTTVSIGVISVLCYGSANDVTEAWILSLIFAVSLVWCILSGRFFPDTEYRRLLIPGAAIALLSVFQGSMSLILQGYSIFRDSVLSPLTYEITTSFWVGVKLIGFLAFFHSAIRGTQIRFKFFIFGTVAAGNFIAFLGILRHFVHSQFNVPYFVFQDLEKHIGFGTFLNQNHFAFFVLMIFGLNLSLLFRGVVTRFARIVLVFATLMSWTAIVMTGSRAGILSSFVVVAFAIFFPARRHLRKHSGSHPGRSWRNLRQLGRKTAVLATIVLAMTLGVVFIGQERVLRRFENLPTQLESEKTRAGFKRIDAYSAAIYIVESRPLFGVGFGGYKYAVSKHIDASGRNAPAQVHNDYLEYAASGGIVGVLFLLWFAIEFARLALKRLAEQTDHFIRAARVGALCGIAGICAHSFFDFGFQITANFLFFGALAAIAIGGPKPSDEPSRETERPETTPVNKKPFPVFAGGAVYLVLLSISLTFGLTRYTISKPSFEESVDHGDVFILPFDAKQEIAIASSLKKSNRFSESLTHFYAASRLRPMDYSIWLNIARLEESRGQFDQADTAYKKAIDLAPNYAEPNFEFGRFLVRMGKSQIGFSNIRKAIAQDPVFFEKGADLAWNETGKNGFETIDLINPKSLSVATMLSMYFLERSSYSSLVDLLCTHEYGSQSLREVIIKRLLEKRQFLFADQIHKKNCGPNAVSQPSFINGDFESAHLVDNSVFGWKTSGLPDSIKASIDEDPNPNYGLCLRIDFNGDANPDIHIVSQTVVLQPKSRYLLSFSYRSSELVTGGMPLVEVLLLNSQENKLITQFEIERYESWRTFTTFLNTGENSDAVEIRLTRRPCKRRLCPISGKLWFDEFKIEKWKRGN